MIGRKFITITQKIDVFTGKYNLFVLCKLFIEGFLEREIERQIS